MQSQDNPIQPDSDIEPDVAVEWTPHSVEDTGISNEDKINRLLATAVTVRQELHERARKIIIGLAVAGLVLILAFGAATGVLVGLSRQADDLEAIATSNAQNGVDIKAALTVLNDATGDEARERSRVTLTVAINELRRSIDCVALYLNDERPIACTEVARRMDDIRAGGDPFVNPATTTTVPR